MNTPKISDIKKVLVVAEGGRIFTVPIDLLKIKGDKGDQGDEPSDVRLLNLVAPLMPRLVAPLISDERITELIEPLIPEPIKGDEGPSPSDEHLKALMRPLIPQPIKGDPGHTPTVDELSALIAKAMPTRKQLLDLISPLIPSPVKGDKGDSLVIADVIKQLPPFPNEAEIRRLITELMPKPVVVDLEEMLPKAPKSKPYKVLGFNGRGVLDWISIGGGGGGSLVQRAQINDLASRVAVLELGGGSSPGGGGTWGSIIGTLSDQTDLQAALDALAAAIAGVAGNASQNSFLVSGGQVVWVQQYQFLVSSATYYIGGVLYTSAQQTITLDVSDPTLDRIDVIAVDDTGTVVKVTGTAATEPSEPDTDPGSQLKLSIVFVRANTTQPATVDSETVYAELQASGEWDPTTSGSGWTLNTSADPRSGIIHIDATAVGAGSYLQFQIPTGTIDPAAFDQFVVNIKSKSQWANNRGLQVTLRKSGVIKGAAVVIQRSGTFGFDSSDTVNYQQVAIPTGLFSVPSGQLIDQVRIAVFGGAINFRADDISFIGGANGQFATGITQEQADARYGFRVLQAVVTDPQGTAIVTGDRQGAPIIIPQEMDNWKITRAAGHVTTVSSSGIPTVQLHNLTKAIDILSTRITIDVNEKDSTTAASQPVVNVANQIVNAGDEIWADIDVSGTGAKGLIVTITLERA